MDDSEDGDYQLAERDGERLVSCLPSITHFAVILPQIYPFLLQACLVETNLDCLQHYMMFLAQNYPHEKLYESVIGISRLIIDRFDIIKKILSPLDRQRGGASVPGSDSLILLGSLFELYRNAMEAAVHSQAMPQLSSSADFLLVTFPKVSQKAILHTAIVQAIFLLLAQEPPQGTAAADFMYLLDLWIPTQPLSRPEVSTIEGNEKLSLPPKEVLPSTLMSKNSRVLEVAVQSAKPSVLWKFVKQFGCPVVAVDKVLEVLDDMCREHGAATELRQSMLDPLSVAKCVEIQMCRGITNGKHFLTFVSGLAGKSPDGSRDSGPLISERDYRIGVSSSLLKHAKPATVRRVTSEPSTEECRNTLQDMSVEEVEQQLLQIFHQSSSSPSQARSEMRSVLSVLDFTAGDHKSPSGCTGYLPCLIAALHQLLSGSSVRSMQFLEGMIKTRFSLTLLRMILKLRVQGKLGSEMVGKFRSILRSICQLLESSLHKVDKLKLYLSFVSVLRSCCEELGVRFHLERKVSDAATSKACNAIRVRKDPFENEASLIKLSCDLTQTSSLRNFETLITTLVKRSVVLNLEVKCLRLLQSIRTAVAKNCAPIACQYCPGLFSAGTTASLLKADGENCEVMEMDSAHHLPDITGLLVDVFELLDPEIFSLCQETATKFLFGCSDTLRAAHPLRAAHMLSSAHNLLLSGQGYLLARLVNNSSWQCLLKTINHMLDKHLVQEW